MRAAARILLTEATALRPILERAPDGGFDRPTVCVGWSVRDVLAHCGAALTHVALGTVHRFTPEDNERDVDERRSWPRPAVLAELFAGYAAAAEAIDRAGGVLDGIGLGEWIHGGDVREALGESSAYASEGSELAVELLVARSHIGARPAIDVSVDGVRYTFGSEGEAVAKAVTDLETFVRLAGGRRPDPGRYRLAGCTADDLRLFS